MQSIIEIGGTTGFIVLALPLAFLLLATLLSLSWPRVAATSRRSSASTMAREEASQRESARSATPAEGPVTAIKPAAAIARVPDGTAEPAETTTEAESRQSGFSAPLDADAATTKPSPVVAPPAAETSTSNEAIRTGESEPLERTDNSHPPVEAITEPASEVWDNKTAEPEPRVVTVPPPPSVADDSEVAALIEAALEARESGKHTAAADSLRNAIIRASRLQDRRGHARARLELGDISQSEGDLITACEHWQMARSLYEEASDKLDAERCEKKMLDNGCPTDWVLTDF